MMTVISYPRIVLTRMFDWTQILIQGQTRDRKRLRKKSIDFSPWHTKGIKFVSVFSPL